MLKRFLALVGIALVLFAVLFLVQRYRSGSRLAIGHAGPRIPVRDLVRKGSNPLSARPGIADVKDETSRLYLSYGWRSLWWDGKAVTDGAKAMMQRLARADSLGLVPEDYDASRLVAAARELDSSEKPSRDQLTRFDLGLTVAAARFARALALGRVSTAEAGVHLRAPRVYSPTAFLDSLRIPEFQGTILDRIQPHTRQYRLLLGALQGYRAQAAQPDPARDGALVPPLQERIHKVQLALERARWLPRETEGPVVIVNIPSYRLSVLGSLDKPGDSVMSMDVVVGQALDHKTPVFLDEIIAVVFRPYWEVPTSIATDELVPKLAQDEQFLEKNHMVLVSGAEDDAGQEVSGSSGNLDRIGKDVRIRQLPGPDNALGSIKFLLPNKFGIYLHDTPAQSFFDRSRRDFSHGCVRVAEPMALAKYLLREQPQWTDERISTAIAEDRPTTANLKAPVPVYILYRTAEAQENGNVLFYNDVYGLDDLLDRLLRRETPDAN